MRDLYYEHYSASAVVQVVHVPPRPYLMLEISCSYEAELQMLRSVASSLSTTGEAIYAPMPLEGLWTFEASVGGRFDPSLKHAYRWLAGICLPPTLTDSDTHHLVGGGGMTPTIVQFGDGSAVQALHTGPYDASGPTIDRLHHVITERGAWPVGAHHEIYLTDPLTTPPEKAVTILRQPFRNSHVTKIVDRDG